MFRFQISIIQMPLVILAIIMILFDSLFKVFEKSMIIKSTDDKSAKLFRQSKIKRFSK